ncbi:hypothetical protein [Campylobacter sp. US33a]|uniref:hypothetical protein n=1 Tax=Campylobacter sp. US33a TaxID=2498120 RepID=UPI0010681910|nr:hypothetical protein [Campylobacter sp. US33a]TEY00716.1 hypothetical protein ELQ16_08765 [Campylobacter sp. US33a]
MNKKILLMLLVFGLMYGATNSGREANNIVLGSSYGKQVIQENNLSGSNLLNKEKPKYYNETVYNWVNYFSNSNPRGIESVGKQEKMVVAYVPQENNASNVDNNATDLAVVKGYCYITEDISVGKQPGSLRLDCQTNVGAITMFSNLVTVNEKASLVVDPVYIEKNGVRFDVKSSVVTNENKTSYNIATFVNDRKIAQIGWGALSVGSDEFKTASNEYLQALEKSKTKQDISYINVGDGAGNSYPQAVVMTNTEEPDPLDYLVKGAINVTASVVKNTADIFRKDLPYLYYVSKDSKIWIDLKVNKQGVYVK